MKIVIVGDRIVSSKIMKKAVEKLVIKTKPEIVTLNWKSDDRSDFQKRAQNIEINGPNAEEVPKELYKEIQDADMLFIHFCPVPEKLLKKANKLKLIATCRGGSEHIDVNAASNMNIPVINTIRNAEATSDFTIGLIYAESRNIAKGHCALMNGEWKKNYPNEKFTKHINELVIGVIGLGNIGRLVAKKANALNMQVIGYDPFVSVDDLKGSNIEKMDDMKAVFRQADVISIHLRATPKTEEIINAELLDEMKETAYLINTSRAQVINKEDLYKSLKNHSIGGAALDVFWEEPIPVDDPILKLDNVTITPHLAGNVVEALPQSPFMMVENINEFFQNNQVNKAINSKVINIK